MDAPRGHRSLRDAMDMLRCRRCGEVIGMYEPLITIVAGHSRETSRAAENGDGGATLVECYHADCYESVSTVSG